MTEEEKNLNKEKESKDNLLSNKRERTENDNDENNPCTKKLKEDSIKIIKLGSRPEYEKRLFHSKEIDSFIEEMSNKIKDENLKKLFINCYPNTLDTTVEYDKEKEDTFIITGDIEAMWLRDSCFQIYPYLSHCKKDEHLKNMIKGMFNRQLNSILIDPYANAFNKTELESPWINDLTYKKTIDGKYEKAMNKKIWERKFELDSLTLPIFTILKYIEFTNDKSIINDKFYEVLNKIIFVLEKEKRGFEDEDKEGGPEYLFQRIIKDPYDSLNRGRGSPCKTCGMIKTSFRNSDDSSIFPYNIPENCLLVSVIELLFKLIEKNKINENLFNKLENICKEVKESIFKYGVFIDYENNNEKYFAHEIDGFGNFYFMDEPGYPNLISLPFFNFCSNNDEIYLNTRKRILSEKNPFYIKGKFGPGESSTHGQRNFIWPLFTIMRGLTSNNKNEIKECLDLLVESGKNSGFIHESYHVDDVNTYTRDWFAWANSFFGLFVEKISIEYPDLIF